MFFGDDELRRASDAPIKPSADGTSDDGSEGKKLGLSLAASLVPALTLLPITVLALLPFWAVIGLVSDVPLWMLVLGYLLIGVSLLFRSTQQLLLTTFFDAREPTPRELEILEPAWNNVLDAADIPRDRYLLAVSNLDRLDAFAAGGHVVAVSRTALTLLPPDELEAALAHELGHHLGLHSVSRLVALWLEAPLLLFARLGSWLELLAYGLALLYAVTENFPAAVGALLAGLAVRVASHLIPAATGITGLLHSLRDLCGRYSVYYADRVAADLGYADELMDLLERTVEHPTGGEDGRSSEHLAANPALVAKRIERLEGHGVS